MELAGGWACWAALGLPFLFLALYLYVTWNYDYWKKRAVPHVQGVFPWGNIRDILFTKRTIAQVNEQLYREFSGEQVVGFFKIRTPILMLRDPELVKQVLVKDFNSFHDNDFSLSENSDPFLAMNPFSISGERWRKVRIMFKHPQTPMKLKGMVPLVRDVCKKLTEYLGSNQEQFLEARYVAGTFTNDTVATCAFGIVCNSFKDVDNEFRKKSRTVINGDFFGNLAILLAFYAPGLGKLLSFRVISKETNDFYTKVVTDMIKYRKSEGISRNDFLQHLIDENAEAEARGDTKVHTYTEMAAHCMTFFLDGYNTSSLVISFVLFELAKDPEAQERLRQEIWAVAKTVDQLDYDKINKLEYLQMVLAEALRLHPPVPVMTRKCTEDTVLRSGTLEVAVERGTPITVPVLSLHTDPLYFPEPERFLPERFAAEAKGARTPFTYLPFGEGPRICLGMKFANITVCMALASIVMNFELSLKDPKAKIEQDTDSSFLYMAKGGVWIKFRKIQPM